MKRLGLLVVLMFLAVLSSRGQARIDLSGPGSITLKGLGSPTVTITQGGTPGSTSYQYALVGLDASSNTRSLYSTSATGNAVLDSTNFNIITVPAWPTGGNYILPAGACKIYRTTSSGSPSSTGLIGTLPACAAGGSFNDTGLAGDSTTVPSDTSGALIAQMIRIVGGCGGSVTQYGFPTCVTISVEGRPSTDVAPVCIVNSNLVGQALCAVVKNNGQTEWIFGNAGCMGDIEVNSTGDTLALGPVSNSPSGCNVQMTTLNGDVVSSPARNSLSKNLLATGGNIDGLTPSAVNMSGGCALGVPLGCFPLAYNTSSTFNFPAQPGTSSTFPLPPAVGGAKYCSTNIFSQAGPPATGIITFQAHPGDTITYKGVQSALGGSATSLGAAGDDACVEGITTSFWVLHVNSGNWTVQ